MSVYVVEENWQTRRPAVRERSKFIFNNDLFSDVKFVIGKQDSEGREGKRRKLVIPAHKLVLAIGSPVFEAMFYGMLAETRDSIELPDCEYESLLELFRYMYSDEVNLNGSNVMGVLYLAKKYMVPSLADKCMEYLEDNVNPANVFSIFSCAQKYESEKLVGHCWEVIDKHTEKVVKSDEFATIEKSLLETVVLRDGLTIEEIELFKAVDLWATKECERQGVVVDGASKRSVLGETLVKALRFPVMKQKDFASVVLDSKILTPDEIVTVIKCFNSVLTSPAGFPDTKRPGFKVLYTQSCCTYDSFSTFVCCSCLSSDWYSCDFSVDKDIKLHGVFLFGSENSSHSIDVTINMIEDTNKKQVMLANSGKFSSSSLRCKAGPYHGFEVMFDRGVVLVKNTLYCVQAKVTGINLRWPSGVKSVLCSGVTFTFNGEQRIPELLFTL